MRTEVKRRPNGFWRRRPYPCDPHASEFTRQNFAAGMLQKLKLDFLI